MSSLYVVAVANVGGGSSAFQDLSEWDESQVPLHLDNSAQINLVIRPLAAPAATNHKALLAPKQGLRRAPTNARGRDHSPIAGTYALRRPRGKITLIACESCRKRTSKCDGVRPKCNACQSKNLTCTYDVVEDGKTTTQLRAHVRQLAKEIEDMKSVVSLLAMASDRVSSANWAAEIEKNGFAYHSAEDIRKALSGGVRADPRESLLRISHEALGGPTLALLEDDSFGTLGNEAFGRPPHYVGASPYGESFWEKRCLFIPARREAHAKTGRTRERSHSSIGFLQDIALVNATVSINPAPRSFEAVTNALGKFSLDCVFYQRMKQDLLASGCSEVEVFGECEIDVDTLLLGFMDPQDAQPVSTWCSRTCNRLLPAASLPVKLASVWVLTKLMRYLIWPSAENMNANPDWLVPTVGNLQYDMLINLVPWPQVRQLLHQYPQEYSVGHFFGQIGITWPHAAKACYYWDIEAGYTRMTPLFESIVVDLNNWIISPKILEIMPQLEGCIPIGPVS
ncbi:hypothetical protein J3E71DRAFT_245739 [Bipolaris maydis]|nr:hypothetical protein J3E71DRAFT_245739 [Bipolaris maydis]